MAGTTNPSEGKSPADGKRVQICHTCHEPKLAKHGPCCACTGLANCHVDRLHPEEKAKARLEERKRKADAAAEAKARKKAEREELKSAPWENFQRQWGFFEKVAGKQGRDYIAVANECAEAFERFKKEERSKKLDKFAASLLAGMLGSPQ